MYTVIWRTTALDRLADLYVAASVADRERLATGVEALNSQLAHDPLAIGESRAGDRRIAFTDYLVVRYRVDTVQRVARVTAVAPFGRRD
jgi:hypothetical protein